MSVNAINITQANRVDSPRARKTRIMIVKPRVAPSTKTGNAHDKRGGICAHADTAPNPVNETANATTAITVVTDKTRYSTGFESGLIRAKFSERIPATISVLPNGACTYTPHEHPPCPPTAPSPPISFFKLPHTLAHERYLSRDEHYGSTTK